MPRNPCLNFFDYYLYFSELKLKQVFVRKQQEIVFYATCLQKSRCFEVVLFFIIINLRNKSYLEVKINK